MISRSAKFFAVSLLGLLMFLSLQPDLVAPTYVDAQQSQQLRRVPGMPDDALQFNRSDITPVRRMERITARKTHAFHYRNVTLMLNCSRNLELNLTIDSRVRTRYFSLIIEPSQSIRLNMNISVSPPPGVRMMERSLSFYTDIEPNATIPLRAQLRLYVNQTAFQMELNRVINASRLMWTYWNRTRSRWVPVASYIDEDGYLFCNTTSFSTWTVVEMVPLQIAGSLSEEEVTFGETVTVSATVKDEEGNPVEGATVPVSIDQTAGLSLFSLSDLGNGNYGGTLDTGELGVAGATYAIILTAEKEGYYPSQETLTLNVQPQPTDWTIYVVVGVVIVTVAVIALILIRRS